MYNALESLQILQGKVADTPCLFFVEDLERAQLPRFQDFIETLKIS